VAKAGFFRSTTYFCPTHEVNGGIWHAAPLFLQITEAWGLDSDVFFHEAEAYLEDLDSK
jgi:hypothetical protein